MSVHQLNITSKWCSITCVTGTGLKCHNVNKSLNPVQSNSILFTECDLEKYITEKEVAEQKVVKQQQKLSKINKQYDKLKTLFERKDQSRTCRENTRTTHEIITNNKSGTRREETKNVLEFIHGGEEGTLYGAWDFLSSTASKTMMENLVAKYNRGRYLEGIVKKTVKELTEANSFLNDAISLKYKNFLSRRKYNLLCKTQSSVFDTDKEVWVPRNVKCWGFDVQLSLSNISNESIDKFVKTLDIGCVCQIPDVSGVTRTITGLVFMIMDIHLRLPHLGRQLVWFKGNTNHFIFQFSDDGAPETSQLSMSIGSLTLWNLGQQVRSREFQYLLHCVSLNEKHDALELLWQQHTEEMLLLEASVFTVSGKECTLQFQPSADMSWQSWACNKLNQAATYPSPYANVHKGNMDTMGGSIGYSSADLWKPYDSSDWEKHISMVSSYLTSLPKSLTASTLHTKKLAFMAEHGIRQLGSSRIGLFADRVKPDPLHCEINAWQHVLDLIYSESVRLCAFDKFIQMLSAPVGVRPHVSTPLGTTEIDETAGSAEYSFDRNDNLERAGSESVSLSPEMSFQPGISLVEMSKKAASANMSTMLETSTTSLSSSPSDIYGCGLSYLSTKVVEHYGDEKKRFNKLSVRL